MINTAKRTVLVTSAGRRGALIECFRDGAQRLGIDLRVVAADMDPDRSAACQLADAKVRVPRCSAPEFIPAVLRCCKEEGVNLVVPTIDTELATLSEARAQFEDQGVEIAVSSPRVVALAGNKEQTAQVLARAGLPTPRTLSAGDFLARPTELDEPLILKPRAGSSSIGLVRPRDVEEARRIARESPELIVQERWSGREYTVNLYFDGRGALRCAVPHWRIETRQGEVSKGQTEDVPSLRAAARKLAACLEGARAALCFQAIVREDGSYAIFEINARFGGGYPLAHRAGARFAQWLLEESLGRECTAADDWSAGVTMLRYDAAVFLE